MVGGEELGGRKVVEGLVRADVVVGVLPTEQLSRQAGDVRLRQAVVVELLAVGAVRPLDAAVELRAARWEEEEGDAPVACAWHRAAPTAAGGW